MVYHEKKMPERVRLAIKEVFHAVRKKKGKAAIDAAVLEKRNAIYEWEMNNEREIKEQQQKEWQKEKNKYIRVRALDTVAEARAKAIAAKQALIDEANRRKAALKEAQKGN